MRCISPAVQWCHGGKKARSSMSIPGLPPQIEGHVVLQLKPGREGEAPHAMVKQLLKVTAKDILLHQYNPARDRAFPRGKVVSVHRVLEWDELLGI
jgi:hypothetical protein